MTKWSLSLMTLILMGTMLLQTACEHKKPEMVVGYIKPSINHMPLTYALAQNPAAAKQYRMVAFASGWEVQEAVAAGKLDMAIMPFTYAWTLRSKGHKIKTMACLERETDGIISSAKISTPADLNHTRIGLLRASSLEALLDDYVSRIKIEYTPVYFRSPTELTAALSQGSVDAIVTYVPVIQKLPKDLKVIHWFSEDYPQHPCCNLIITEKALTDKPRLVKNLYDILQPGIDAFNTKSASATAFLSQYFSLNPAQTADAMQHVKYQSYVSEEDAAFERKMMQDFVKKGYLTSLPTYNEMYYFPKD